jgi:O-antigen ligase
MTSHNIIDRFTTYAVLGTVFLVPLAMPVFHGELTYAFGEFKTFTLHIGGVLITAGLTAESISRQFGMQRSRLNFDLIKRSPTNLAITGLVLLLVTQILSLIMSPLPHASFFGLYDGFNGFNVYDWISMSVVMLGVSLKIRTVERLELLVSILVIVGALTAVYGLAQHFGWDGFAGRQASSRILSSFGNTLNFAGFLVITIPLTISLFVSDRWRKPHLVSIAILLLGIQLSAAWFTGGRAAYIAIFVGIVVLLFLLAKAQGRTILLRTVGLVTISGLVAALLIIIPSPNPREGLSRLTSIDDEFSQFLTEQTSSGGGAFSGRSEIWKTAFSLILDPEVPQQESHLITRLRTIFGFGPDMFVHSYTLRMEPRIEIQNQVNAHNIVLHVLVTTGILGFASLVIVIVGFALIGANVFSRITDTAQSFDRRLLLLVVFFAVLVGKSIELLAGVPRVGDLVPLVAIIGATIATYSIVEDRSIGSIPAKNQGRLRNGDRRSGHTRIQIGLGLFGLITLTTLFVTWDIPRMKSTMIVTSAKSMAGTAESGEIYLEANRHEPQRMYYVNKLTPAFLNASSSAFEDGRLDDANEFLFRLRELWLGIVERDPYDFTSQFMLAKIMTIIYERGNTEFSKELIDRHSKIVSYFPGYPVLVGTASTVAASVGDYKSAILFANQAIADESRTVELSRTWYAKGISLFVLGFEEEGISDLLTATTKRPDSEAARNAHRALGKIYRDRGDVIQADFHSAEGSN